MKRNIGKNISEKVRIMKEDMYELQRLMRHKSVYAKQSIKEYSRKPKHPKRVGGFKTGVIHEMSSR